MLWQICDFLLRYYIFSVLFFNPITMSYEFINGQQVFTVESTYTTSVAWSNGRKLFVVDGAMAKDELLKIAESVQLIK